MNEFYLNSIFTEEFKGFLNKLINNISESIKVSDKEASLAILELFKHGWYISLDSNPSMVVELGRELLRGDLEKVNDFLTLYYEEQLNELENRIITHNKNRIDLIKEAFDNHRCQRYYSSITLFITQIDGLCYDVYKKFYFKNNRDLQKAKTKIYKPEVEAFIKYNNKFKIPDFEIPLNEINVINDHSINVSNYSVKLNRHEIIHGMDYQYGTKINSLKIISLLNYINFALHYN
ncbi:hypothetical protein KO500_04885 [Cellulophaga baltica]|uniref:hypothetical protein n=1 Tax=Cellulophaga TaxID=104264 RepID=UPI001C06C668|nr:MULTISPECIES: hypothetical protein [Cellulophaga]MBU2995754.1 hypothetical protein [Cellulophaga baltica]MDO6767148.1 hypothetical protein [Cellulophaga sp. 1_MG-2023]